MNLDGRVYMTLLLDVYGDLLTKKQQSVLRMAYEEDLSLSEISEITGVSRSAVLDTKTRGEKCLRRYEDALSVIGSAERRKKALTEAKALIEKASLSVNRPDLLSAIDIIGSLLAGEIDGL